jgi:3-isopropylmalate/(R)-2-methylmalate dehydratase small subunit
MRIWRYGDDVNTDQLFPGKYTYTCISPEEIIPHLLEDLDPEFAGSLKPGDIIVAGRNFGCGSSREQPAVGLKEAGIAAIIAESFARIFFRSAVNQGLLLLESPEAVAAWQEGEDIVIDPAAGEIKVGERTFKVPPLPPMLLSIRDAGGLLPAIRARLEKERGRAE